MPNTPNPATSDHDQPTAAEMEAFNHFDPVAEIPSPVEIVGDVRLGAEPTLNSFSPEQQTAIMERAGNDRSEPSVKAAIHSFLLDKRRELLIRGGAGQGATQTQRTMLEHANQVRQLDAEIGRIDADLSDVLRYETQIDGNGQPVPVPVYAKQGDARTALEARKTELARQMALIAGVEGDRQLREANRADALAAREARERVAEFHEAERRAKQIAKEDRINKMAEAKAKFLKDNLG